MKPPLIKTQSLTKRFRAPSGIFAALSDCTLSIKQGEVFGLLGPNGAGKSTLIRLLLGFLNPTSGSAEIDELDCHKQRVEVHKLVAYLPGDARLFRMMRGRSVLKLFSQFRDGNNSGTGNSFETGKQIADRLELDLDRWVGLMSTGMRQKLALAICLAADTPLLILDEPTANLDPTVRGRVLDFIIEAKKTGRTVLFSSHVLSEIEEVCDRVGILRSGKMVHLAPMSEIRMQHRIKAHLKGELPALPLELENVVSIKHLAGAVQIETPGELSKVLKWLGDAPLADVQIEPVGLRSVYDRFHSERTELNQASVGNDSVGNDSVGNDSVGKASLKSGGDQ